MAADYVTLKKRPLLMTGTWNASTGTEAITDEDLSSIVSAYNAGVLDPAVIKIGHVDARFNTYAEDGSPAYGQITNLSVEDGVLYGDYEFMPADLAASLDSAYPRSSVELARNVVLRDQDGNVVHEFGCVLTANALLGATAPAVKGLSTKMSSAAALSSGTPVFLEINTTQFALSSDGASHFALPGGGTANDLADKLRATVAQTHSAETTWAYLIDFTDDKAIFGVEGYDDSVTYEQTYSMDDKGLPILEGDPVQVIKETRWIREDGEPVVAAEKNDGDTPDVHPDTPETPESVPEDNTPPSPQSPAPEHPLQPQGEIHMSTLDNDKAADLRKRYGLPENATYQTILENVLAEKDGSNYVAPGSDETPNDVVKEQQTAEQAANPNFAAAAESTEQVIQDAPAAQDEDDEDDDADKDTAKVSKSALSAMQSQFAEMQSRFAAREAAEVSARRDGLVTKWFRAGLIHDDEAERVRKRLDRDEALTTELIEERTPMFSTSEIGHGQAAPSFFAAGTKDELTQTLDSDDLAFGATK